MKLSTAISIGCLLLLGTVVALVVAAVLFGAAALLPNAGKIGEMVIDNELAKSKANLASGTLFGGGPLPTVNPGQTQPTATPVPTAIPVPEITLTPGNTLFQQIVPTDVPPADFGKAYPSVEAMARDLMNFARSQPGGTFVQLARTEGAGVGTGGIDYYKQFIVKFRITDARYEIGAASTAFFDFGTTWDLIKSTSPITFSAETGDITVTLSFQSCINAMGIQLSASNFGEPATRFFAVAMPSDTMKDWARQWGMDYAQVAPSLVNIAINGSAYNASMDALHSPKLRADWDIGVQNAVSEGGLLNSAISHWAEQRIWTIPEVWNEVRKLDQKPTVSVVLEKAELVNYGQATICGTGITFSIPEPQQ